jgi:DNA-binding NarL/FixJ family response regulator
VWKNVPDPSLPTRGPQFQPADSGFRSRTASVNQLLQPWPLVGASGSWLEAHLMARGALSLGEHNILGTCINADEVLSLLRVQCERCLLLMVDSIAADHGQALVGDLRRLRIPPVIVLLVEDLHWLRANSYPVDQVDAVIHTHSFGSGVLINGLRAVARGDRYLDPAILPILQATATQIVPRLTSREQSTLQELAQGLTNREIAARLGVAETTIRDYVGSLLAKFHAVNRTQVVRRALELGLLHQIPSQQ